MRRPILIGVVAGIALVAGLALLGPGALTASGLEPNSCGACHVMESNVASFQESHSLHKTELSCSDCHLPSGLEGLTEKYKVGYRHIMVNLKGEAPTEISLRAQDRDWIVANCVRCHDGSEHIQQVGKNACLTCHSNDPHGERGSQ